MANTDLESIAQRLDRIEQILDRFSGIDFVNPVDPSPEDLGRLRPDVFHLRLIDLLRHIIIKGDPPPRDLSRVQNVSVESRLSQLLQRRPGPIADPAAEDLLNTRLLDLVRRWHGGTTDPGPEDLANVRLSDLLRRVPGGGVGGDPAPQDIARLSKQEVEQQIHKLNAEVVRLNSLQKLLQERLGQVKEG